MIFATNPLGSISVPYLGTFSLPPTDAELLKSLQPPEVHRWTLARIKECEEYLRTLRSVHNAAATIHVSLPVEVIMRIFLNIELDSVKDIVVMHVCRIWRAILLNIPEFFANLLGVVKKIGKHRKDNNGLLRMLLQFSGTRKLIVNGPYLDNLAWHAGPLVPHLHRIRSLTVDLEVPDFIDFHRLLKRGAMPELADLTVSSNVQDRQSLETEMPRLVPWAEADLPSLRRLDMTSAIFTQASAYPPLVFLSLKHGVVEDTRIAKSRIPRLKSPTLFLQALLQCSHLRILDIFNALPTTRSGWDVVDHPSAIDFPELCELRVREDHRRSLSRFLHHITFPPTASLDLTSGDHMFSDVLPVPHRQLLLNSATAFHFSPPPEATNVSILQVFKGTQKSLVIRVRVSGELLPYLAALVGDISALFPSNLGDVGMSCQSRFYLIHTKMLNSFPHVKRLSLTARDSPQDFSSPLVGNSDIINRLLAARSSNWQRFVCPKLEDLVIKGFIPSAATLVQGLRPALQTRQTRLKSLEVHWKRKIVQGNPAFEMPGARLTILQDALADLVDRTYVDEY